MTTDTLTLTEFLLARIAEDEAAAKTCAEMFPSPWEVADRGWRVRIYAGDVPDVGDHAEPGWVRQPVAMEVEPDRRHDDPLWLSERVAHIARHDPARVLAQCKAKRYIVENSPPVTLFTGPSESWVCRALASIYADHEDYRAEWAL